MPRVSAVAETGEVGAAVAVGNGVGEAEDLVVVGVVVLEHHVSEHIIAGFLAVVVEFDLALAVEDDRLIVDDGFVFTELDDELLDAPLA